MVSSSAGGSSAFSRQDPASRGKDLVLGPPPAVVQDKNKNIVQRDLQAAAVMGRSSAPTTYDPLCEDILRGKSTKDSQLREHWLFDTHEQEITTTVRQIQLADSDSSRPDPSAGSCFSSGAATHPIQGKQTVHLQDSSRQVQLRSAPHGLANKWFASAREKEPKIRKSSFSGGMGHLAAHLQSQEVVRQKQPPS